MRPSVLTTLLAAILSILCSLALEGTEVADAARPLSEGVPEVAIVRLRALLGKNLSADDWRAATEKLADALTATGRPGEALTLLSDERLRDSIPAKYSRAQALASLERWSEALPMYDQVAADPRTPIRTAALFGSSEALRALGRTDEARQKLAGVMRDNEWQKTAQLRMAELYLDAGDTGNARRILGPLQPTTATERKTRRFLQGRVEMVEQHPDKAIVILEALLKKPEGASHPLVIATLFQVADAHLRLRTPELGDDFIEDFINHHPKDVDLALIFAKLDQLYQAEKRPARAELERWTREPEQPRRAFAQWYAARIDLRAGRRDRAFKFLGDMRSSAPKIADLVPALIEFAQVQMEDGQVDEALSILNEARALGAGQDARNRIDLIAAQAQFRAGQYDKAASIFERIADSNSSAARIGAFNAALSNLQRGNDIRFAANSGQVEKAGGNRDDVAELRLEQGLAEAADKDPKALQSLQRFVREFPQSPRVADALVAMAEIAFHRSPPDQNEARKFLSQTAQSNPSTAAKEHAEYLSIWLEDATAGNNARVIELALHFLEQHPESVYAGDVRMKLGETYYRVQDFANAETHFRILGQQIPATSLTEKALFLAGESAMSSMAEHGFEQALTLFDQVAQLNGELRWAARNEQAAIERKLGKQQDALVLYDEVLKNVARPVEKREALCGKGDVYVELASSDTKNFDRAIEAYGQLANDAREPGHWRNQALFKKGVALEKKADRDTALTTFYEVLDTPARPDRPPEFFWFYKAGFNAGRLLEESSKWESAAAVYQKLVAAGGPRSEEAKSRLNRIRLEHFLWEQ